MTAENITLVTPNGNMEAYLAPAESPKGAVIVIQEAFGVTSHIEEVTRRAAEAGFTAIAPQLFHRLEADQQLYSYDNLPGALESTGTLNGQDLLEDVDACIARLGQMGFAEHEMGIVGFCMGGTVAYWVNTQRSLGAAVTFYGGGIRDARWPATSSMLDGVRDVRGAWLGLFGDEDQTIPVDDVEELRKMLAIREELDAEIVRFPAAGHGFHCNDRPAMFNADAAADAWRRTIEWFEQHLQSTPRPA